uniref:DDE-1 domain-containing protein n=1 Tax=Romanomermis culicivorax TaxID=13658 RepID=A0A915LBV2_ROMCU
MAIVPGGCTKYIQAPDVCWNKQNISEFYDKLLSTGEKELTKGGQMKVPNFDTVLCWIKDAWDSLSPDMIKKSFKIYGVNNINGSEDALIKCFQPGQDCGDGCKMLEKIINKLKPEILDVEDGEEDENNIGSKKDEDDE